MFSSLNKAVSSYSASKIEEATTSAWVGAPAQALIGIDSVCQWPRLAHFRPEDFGGSPSGAYLTRGIQLYCHCLDDTLRTVFVTPVVINSLTFALSQT